MNATRKGLLGGSPMWRAVWVLLSVRKGWSKVSKSGEAPVTFTEPLREGEAWTIVHVPEESKRGRGEGRKLGIGPKRKPPRATAIAPPALAEIGKRIIEAPSAARVNEILGTDLVSDPEPSRYAKRQEKKSAKSEKRAAAKSAKRAERSADKALKKAARADEKAERIAEKADRREAKAEQAAPALETPAELQPTD